MKLKEQIQLLHENQKSLKAKLAEKKALDLQKAEEIQTLTLKFEDFLQNIQENSEDFDQDVINLNQELEKIGKLEKKLDKHLSRHS